jgi:hypothetical protein
MVSRLAKRGMPTDSIERAERWRKRHLDPGRVKGVRADTMEQLPASALPIAEPVGLPDPAADLVTQAGAAAAEPGAAAPAADGGQQPTDPGYQLSRSRQAAADARTAEIKLAELEGSLVRIDQVKAQLAAMLAPVREGLLQIPARLAPDIAPQSDPGRIQTLLEIEIHRVLAPLSKAIDGGSSTGVGQA